MNADRTDNLPEELRTSRHTWRFWFGVAVFLGLGLIVAVAPFLALGPGTSPPIPPVPSNSPGQRLAVLTRNRPNYRVLIGLPPGRPVSWAVASRVDDDIVTVEGRGEIPLADVRAFAVMYANGLAVDCELAGLPLPPGMTGRSPRLQLDDLEEGRKYVRVTYGSSGFPEELDHYSTIVTNVSRQRVRVLKFASYARTPDGWRLNTATGTYYTAQDFRQWYGRGDWLVPEEAADDNNNWGGPPILWAYFCEAEDGKKFVAGGVLEGS